MCLFVFVRVGNWCEPGSCCRGRLTVHEIAICSLTCVACDDVMSLAGGEWLVAAMCGFWVCGEQGLIMTEPSCFPWHRRTQINQISQARNICQNWTPLHLDPDSAVFFLVMFPEKDPYCRDLRNSWPTAAVSCLRGPCGGRTEEYGRPREPETPRSP